MIILSQSIEKSEVEKDVIYLLGHLFSSVVTFGFHWGNVFKSPNWAEQRFYEDCGDITYSPDCGGDCGNIDGHIITILCKLLFNFYPLHVSA